MSRVRKDLLDIAQLDNCPPPDDDNPCLFCGLPCGGYFYIPQQGSSFDRYMGPRVYRASCACGCVWRLRYEYTPVNGVWRYTLTLIEEGAFG